MVMVSNQSAMVFGYLAGAYPGAIGHLYSPGGQRGPYGWMPYALDNGAWSAFKNNTPWSEAEWLSLLRWACLSGQRPLWSIVPDVVGDRDATLRQWDVYAPMVSEFGFRRAFAVQDGMKFSDVPDDDCMLFLGGSTGWKDDAIPAWCAEFRGRVHVGRVNKPDRLIRCYQAGAVSVDGTGWFHRKGGQLAELVRFITETKTDTDTTGGDE